TLERLPQRIERRGAGRQALAVARQLEAGIDALADRVGEVVHVEAGDVPRAILQAEVAERPGERVLVAVRGQRGEARALGQEGPAGDAQRQLRIGAAQEADRRVHRVE